MDKAMEIIHLRKESYPISVGRFGEPALANSLMLHFIASLDGAAGRQQGAGDVER